MVQDGPDLGLVAKGEKMLMRFLTIVGGLDVSDGFEITLYVIMVFFRTSIAARGHP